MRHAAHPGGAPSLRHEHGTIVRHGKVAAAVGYPAPYNVGASSLGAQYVYKLFNRVPDLACGRFFLRDDGTADHPPLVLESNRPIADMQALAFSISCEQEMMGIARLLKAGGIAPLAADRSAADPSVIIGGPLTVLDPRLVAPLADMVVIGAADHLISPIGEGLVSHHGDKASLLKMSQDISPAVWVPTLRETPEVDPAPLVPARPASAATWSSEAELKNLFLVEATRGCKRRCAFCTMSRDAVRTPCFHAFDIDDILAEIPADAPGVGLVGAAVTDHPQIEALVEAIAATGKRVSLSSIRADRLSEKLAVLLKQSGLRTLTVAADGASEAVRRSIHKGITEAHLIAAADIARASGFAGLKVYAMVGLPGETDDDVMEFAALLLNLASRINVSTTVQAFVPKPGTPLHAAPMEKVTVIERRLGLLRKHTKGRVRILPTSPKWSLLDWKLAHGGFQSAHAAVAAEQDGGSFAAWQKAIKRFIP